MFTGSKNHQTVMIRSWSHTSASFLFILTICMSLCFQSHSYAYILLWQFSLSLNSFSNKWLYFSLDFFMNRDILEICVENWDIYSFLSFLHAFQHSLNFLLVLQKSSLEISTTDLNKYSVRLEMVTLVIKK